MSETCRAKIRPMMAPIEIECSRGAMPHDEHKGVLRDYAWPGSETWITWLEGDRRTFRGDWAPCGDGCVLPLNHQGRHTI